MDIAIRLKLAKKVKQLRNGLGFTQEKLSEVSGIDYKYIQRIEGKNPPNIKLETIERLAKTLKTTPSKLLDF
jgi:transcriptional regulator with XRE-family HTH domain